MVISHANLIYGYLNNHLIVLLKPLIIYTCLGNIVGNPEWRRRHCDGYMSWPSKSISLNILTNIQKYKIYNMTTVNFVIYTNQVNSEFTTWHYLSLYFHCSRYTFLCLSLYGARGYWKVMLQLYWTVYFGYHEIKWWVETSSR